MYDILSLQPCSCLLETCMYLILCQNLNWSKPNVRPLQVASVGKAITQFIIFLFTVLLCFFHNHKMPAWCKKIKGQGRTGVFFSQRNVWEIHPFNAYQNLKRQVKQVQNGPMSFSSCFIYVVLWIFILTQLTFLRKLLT